MLTNLRAWWHGFGPGLRRLLVVLVSVYWIGAGVAAQSAYQSAYRFQAELLVLKKESAADAELADAAAKDAIAAMPSSERPPSDAEWAAGRPVNGPNGPPAISPPASRPPPSDTPGTAAMAAALDVLMTWSLGFITLIVTGLVAQWVWRGFRPGAK